VGSAGQKVSNISRSHKLVDHEVSDGVPGLISILGGKMTGYRAIAAEAVDLACVKLGSDVKCSTATIPLPGSPGLADEAKARVAAESGLDAETVAHLNSLYGSGLERIIDLVRQDPRGKQAVCSHSRDILAQVWYAVNEEGAMTVSDFMLRRGTVGLASCRGLDAVEVVGLEMGRLLGWSVGEFQEQVRSYRSMVDLGTQFRMHTLAS
jgi:glycerol-3-phosphate dehydrogenase